MATQSGPRQAPARAQIWLHAVPSALVAWVILTITSPTAFAFNIAAASILAAYSLFKTWVYLWSPSAQKNPGIVAAHVASAVIAIEGCFALAYYLLSARAPSSFAPGVLTRIDAAYFTVSTATTTGMGDIHPATETARLLVTGQMVVSLFLVVTALGVALTRLLTVPTRDA